VGGLEILLRSPGWFVIPHFVTPTIITLSHLPFPPRMGRVKGGLCSFQSLATSELQCDSWNGEFAPRGTSLVRHNQAIVEAQMEVLKMEHLHCRIAWEHPGAAAGSGRLRACWKHLVSGNFHWAEAGYRIVPRGSSPVER
jgi:hypothetical protein